MKTRSTFHSWLNTIGLIAALPLLGFALYTLPLNTIVPLTQQTLASATVAVTAGVAPNHDNTLAQALSAKEAELTVRENKVAQIEAQAAVPIVGTTTDTLALYSLFMSIALFVLVALNFFFDWRRGQNSSVRSSMSTPSLSVDLRVRH